VDHSPADPDPPARRTPDDPSVRRGVDQLAALRSDAGAAALAAAAELSGDDPLGTAAALRARGVAADLAAAAQTQARLRARAAAKFGPDAHRMFFTAAGLEQATRAPVATRRAARLAGAGVRTLADLGCGVGADTIAAARAGIRVYAVEADPVTAEAASANLAALGLDRLAKVEHGRAQDVDLSAVDAVFCDPARRHANSGRRTFDPAAFSPSWDFVTSLPARVPRTVLKLAPGLDHALIPPDAEAQWVSVDRDLVEAALWCGPLAEVPRRATLLRTPSPQEGSHLQPPATAGVPSREQFVAELTGSGERDAPVGPVRRFLLDPDPAVVRARLVAELADQVDGNLADPTIAYLYTDRAPLTPYGRVLEVTEVLPFSGKRLRAALRAAGVGRVEIMKRGSAVDPERLRRDLRLVGDAAATVVLTRLDGAPVALVCRPV
jgi:hypothetical protein